MNGKLRAFGLTLVAAFALCALSAAGASAEGVYTSAVAHTTIEGTQATTNEFVTSAGTVTCAKATFDGTTTTTSSTDLTITPTYSECHSIDPFGITHNATVNMNGCTYTFTTPTTTGKPAPADWHAEVHVLCPEGKQIEIPISGTGCTIDVHAQTPTVPTVDLTNKAGTPDDVLLTSTVEGVTYQTTGSFCAVGQFEKNDGKLLGTVTVKGFDTEGKQVNVTLSHP